MAKTGRAVGKFLGALLSLRHALSAGQTHLGLTRLALPLSAGERCVIRRVRPRYVAADPAGTAVAGLVARHPGGQERDATAWVLTRDAMLVLREPIVAADLGLQVARDLPA